MLFDLAFALRHRVPRGVLKKIGTERHVRPGQVEGPDEKITAEAILEHLALCGWEITKRPGVVPHFEPASGRFVTCQPQRSRCSRMAWAAIFSSRSSGWPGRR